MKRVICIAIALTSVTVFGSPIVYEGFNYPLTPTNLTAQTGSGLTWIDVGSTATPTNRPYIYPGSLTTPGLYPSVGNSVKFGWRGTSANLGFTPTIDSTAGNTIFYSLIVELTDITNMQTSGVFFAALTGGTITTAEPTLLVSALQAKRVGTNEYCLGIKKAGGGITYPSPEITNTVGDVVFVVASYTVVDGPGGTGDIAQMWLNPDPATFGDNTKTPPADIVVNTTANLSAQGYPINSFTLFNRYSTSLSPPHGIIVDELSIGTTWADVTPTTSSVTMSFTTQPKSARVLAGNPITFNALGYRAITYQWQKDGADIPGATGNSYSIAAATPGDVGTYDVVIGNGVSTPLTSTNATLTVVPDIYPRLVPLWSLAPGSRPYLTTDGGNLPNERCIAYNALSNQVLIVSRTNTVTGSTNPAIYVLNADTGADLYQMNVDPIVVSVGLNNNSLSLNYLDVADDGAVIAGNVGDQNPAPFKLYYWTSSGSDPANGPFEVWSGDPSGQGQNRFGDYFAVRGAGANTQVLLDSQRGDYGALLMPTVGQNLTNLDSWSGNGAGGYAYFSNVAGGITGGRTLLFNDSSDSTFWEKHGGGAFNLVGFDTTTNGSTILTNFPNITGSPGQFAFGAGSNILTAIVFASDSSVPDTLVQYDLSDPTQPLFVRSYDFPINHQANGNGCGRVIFAGDRVYALDANNGMAAWALEPVLHITPAPPHQVLSWSAETPGYSLMATPSLTPPVLWTNVSPGTLVGSQYFVTNSPDPGTLFYRLEK